jgi:hypothetical protein
MQSMLYNFKGIYDCMIKDKLISKLEKNDV